MKKLLFVLFFLFFVGTIKSNPIVLEPPIEFSEIYFDGPDWYIEYVVVNPYLVNLDNLRITANSGAVQFKPGIQVCMGQVLVITQDSLQSMLFINKNGDILDIEEYMYDHWYDYYFETAWGPGTGLNAPYPGQSLAINKTEIPWTYPTEYYSCFVKNNFPSIGSDPFNVDSWGIFEGYVFDLGQHPVSNVTMIETGFYSICTDTSGYFHSYMFGRNYVIRGFLGSSLVYQYNVTIEPDSVKYCEFIADTLLVDIENLSAVNHKIKVSAFPNPANAEINFLIEIPPAIRYSKALIKVYSLNGEMIKILPFDKHSDTSGSMIMKWDDRNTFGSLAAGEYFYTLELDGMPVAENKLLLVK